MYGGCHVDSANNDYDPQSYPNNTPQCTTNLWYISLQTAPCLSSPCQNGGTCTEETGAYICACAANYTGSSCEIVIENNPCESAPCQNGATCVPSLSNHEYLCSCATGYSGVLCQNLIDDDDNDDDSGHVSSSSSSSSSSTAGHHQHHSGAVSFSRRPSSDTVSFATSLWLGALAVYWIGYIAR
jgi:hypothetical protein